MTPPSRSAHSLTTYGLFTLNPLLMSAHSLLPLSLSSTLQDAYRKNISLDSSPCILDILDTAGQEDYTALRSTWMRERDGFLLVFSLTDRSTFQGLLPFVEQLGSIHEEEEEANRPPVIVVGNKSDLMVGREVRREEGERWGEGVWQWEIRRVQRSDRGEHRHVLRGVDTGDTEAEERQGEEGEGEEEVMVYHTVDRHWLASLSTLHCVSTDCQKRC